MEAFKKHIQLASILKGGQIASQALPETLGILPNCMNLLGSSNICLQKQVHYFNQRRIDIIAAAVDFPTQSGWLQSNFNLPIGSILILLSWSIMPKPSPVLMDQPSWTHCQTWLLKHRTIALHQEVLRLPHGPH